MKYLLLLVTLSCAMAPMKHPPIEEPLRVKKTDIKGYQFIHSRHLEYLDKVQGNSFSPYVGRYKKGKKYYRAIVKTPYRTLQMNELFIKCGKRERSIKEKGVGIWDNRFDGQGETTDMVISRPALKWITRCKAPIKIGIYGREGSAVIDYAEPLNPKRWEPLDKNEYLKTGIKNLLEYGN